MSGVQRGVFATAAAGFGGPPYQASGGDTSMLKRSILAAGQSKGAPSQDAALDPALGSRWRRAPRGLLACARHGAYDELTTPLKAWAA